MNEETPPPPSRLSLACSVARSPVPTAFVSYTGEVIADSSGKWYRAGLRFATQEEAHKQIRDLYSRWTLVTQTRVVGTMDPVNYRWDPAQGGAVAVPKASV